MWTARGLTPGTGALLCDGFNSRLEEDDEQRTFELEGDESGKIDDSKVVVIDSTELRCHSIEMEVLEAEGPAVRRSTRTAARSATSRARAVIFEVTRGK